jgi:hypothetical protein
MKLVAIGIEASGQMWYNIREMTEALACPGADYVRLWPLPVVQP